MPFDWLKSLRSGYPRRRKSSQLATPAPLESRTLLSAISAGPDLKVNVSSDSSFAIAPDGGFVITWSEPGEVSTAHGRLPTIYAQRYDSFGVPQGSRISVSSNPYNLQRYPSIAMDTDGGFVITWTDNDTLEFGSYGDIFARRYNAVGEPQDSGFRVNVSTTFGQTHSSIAMDVDGNFVISWQGGLLGNSETAGIYARRYNSAGLPQGSEFRVNTFTTGVQQHPSIAMDADGDFVITWQSPNQDGSGDGVYAQRYDPLGLPQGSEFRVNTWTTGSQLNPSIGMNLVGDFVITWESFGQDGSDYGVYAQRYDHFGVPQGSEFRVNSWTTNLQRDPLIGMDADGDFIITWRSLGQDGSDYGVFAQRFDSFGVPQDSEFRVNDWTIGSQVNRLIGMKADGEFLIAWYGLADYAYISGSTGVYVKQFRFHNAAPILDDTGSPALDPLKLNQPLTTNYGTSVADIIARMGPYGGIIDPDLDLIGIAINGVSNSNGSWQYSFNNGYTWTPITVTGNTNALLLIPKDYIRIRFDPDTDFTGKSFFSFVAWDRTNGFNGDTTDVSNRGGSTPFSLDYEYARVTVNNSAPDLNGAGNPTLDTIPMNVAHGDNPGTLVSDIIARMGPYGGMTDADGDPLGIAIGGVSNTDGFWEYTVNGGTTWLTIGTTGNFDALLLASNPDTRIRFIPNPGFIGKSLIAFVAWDGTFGSNGGTAVVSTRGGNTSFSLVYEYARITVNNAAPLLNDTGSPTFDTLPQNQPTATNIGNLVSDIIARMGPSGGITDADGDPLGIAINGLTGTANGLWEYTINGGTTWLPVGTTGNFDARLLAADPYTRIRYLPNAGFIGEAKIAFVAWDMASGRNGETANVNNRGGTTPYSLKYEYASIFVKAAPLLNNAGSPTFDTILMNVANVDNPGLLVSDLIARMGPAGGITILNPGGLQGIAINGLTNTANGTWEYTVNNGTNWTPIGTTGNSNARLLAADPNTRIRYRPNAGFLGEAKLAFVAWDRTTGANGGIANVNIRGGLTPYSLNYEYASINVINIAPVLDNAGSPTLDPILMNVPSANNPGTLISDIIARMSPDGGITDTNPNSPQGIAINGLTGTANGIWEYTVNNGTNWTPIGSTGNFNARLLAADPNTRIRYRPNTDFIGEAKIAFVAWDRSTGSNGGVVSVNNRGGATPYSLVYEYASIFVNNAAPVLNNAGSPVLDPIPQNVYDVFNHGTLVSDIIVRMSPAGGITDPNPGSLQGIAIIGLGNTDTGSWQYTTDNGATWNPVGTTGAGNARLLAADPIARIRYSPQPGFLGTAGFTFVAWDRTAGVNGGVVNADIRGGKTPFSLVDESAGILVVNAAAILTPTNASYLDSIPMNVSNPSNVGTLVSDLIARIGPNGITDPNPAALQGIAINGLTGTTNGTWQYTTNGGTSWSNINTTGNSNARLLAADPNTRIRFVPILNFTGTVKLAFVAWDQTTGINGDIANTTIRGGTTPFSPLYDYASLSII